MAKFYRAVRKKKMGKSTYMNNDRGTWKLAQPNCDNKNRILKKILNLHSENIPPKKGSGAKSERKRQHENSEGSVNNFVFHYAHFYNTSKQKSLPQLISTLKLKINLPRGGMQAEVLSECHCSNISNFCKVHEIHKADMPLGVLMPHD